jgi:hypothetical protein
VIADRVDGLSTLWDQQVTGSERKPGCLLFLALHRYNAHVGPASRIADRLGIRCIVLLPLYERLYVSRRDKPDLMPQLGKFACPVIFRYRRCITNFDGISQVQTIGPVSHALRS